MGFALITIDIKPSSSAGLNETNVSAVATPVPLGTTSNQTSFSGLAVHSRRAYSASRSYPQQGHHSELGSSDVHVRAECLTRNRGVNPFNAKLEASAIGRLHDSDIGRGVVECCVCWNGSDRPLRSKGQSTRENPSTA